MSLIIVPPCYAGLRLANVEANIVPARLQRSLRLGTLVLAAVLATSLERGCGIVNVIGRWNLRRRGSMVTTAPTATRFPSWRDACWLDTGCTCHAPTILTDRLAKHWTTQQNSTSYRQLCVIYFCKLVKDWQKHHSKINKAFMDIRLRPGIATPLVVASRLKVQPSTHRHTAHYGQAWRHP